MNGMARSDNLPLVPESQELQVETAKRRGFKTEPTRKAYSFGAPTGSVWHGKDADARRLEALVDGNCPTKDSTVKNFDPDSPCDAWGISVTCPVHGILADQRTLDGLLFARSMRRRLIAAEKRA